MNIWFWQSAYLGILGRHTYKDNSHGDMAVIAIMVKVGSVIHETGSNDINGS